MRPPGGQYAATSPGLAQVFGSKLPQEPCKPGVLVVDDDRLVRLMMQLGLERNGFEVWIAPNGREAIELYREYRESIHVVLLDVRMPVLDGPATQDALRAIDPNVLVCFTSGDLDINDPEELPQRGAATLIAKPFVMDQLATTLQQLIQRGPINSTLSK